VTVRLKVLLSAYACSPYKGSEPGVGWGFVAELAKYHDLWVIVEEEKFRTDIQRYLLANPNFSCCVKFVFLKKERNRLLRKIWPPSYYWYYRRWHKDAFALAQELHARVGFDLVHQLTMVGFREPGYLWKMGVPFVWGPVGGMGLFPWRFLPVVGGYGALYYMGYNLFNAWQMRFATRPKEAARSAGVGLITATPENQIGAEQYWGCSSSMMCEVGLPPDPAQRPTARKFNEPLRVAWAGLHLPRKALNLALYSLAKLPKTINWELYVLGQGERTNYWQHLARQLGVAERCHFAGWMPRDEAIHIMASSHLMLITSLRDLTSTVTIEALALGLPIVCLDHCGFAGVVNDRCGIKVPVTTPQKVVVGLAEGIARLANNEALRFELAEGAVLRAQDFSWDKKAAAVDAIYRRKLAAYEAIEA
jgi:glycosyltransferase involved in cell wall biosynthesis